MKTVMRCMTPWLAMALLIADWNIAQAARFSGGPGYRIWLGPENQVLTQGTNGFGQLGTGGIVRRDTPQQPTELVGFAAVSARWTHVLALKKDGTVWAWGINSYGQVGARFNTFNIVNVLTSVTGITFAVSSERQPLLLDLPPVKFIAAGFAHSLAVDNQGRLWGWGQNDHGQLGLGDGLTRLLPTQSKNISGLIALAAGWNHSLAIRSDGRVLAWGVNSQNQLGLSGSADLSTPAEVPNLPAMQAVAAGAAYSLALARDGQVWAWGQGNFTSAAPAPIMGLDQVKQVESGSNHILALREDGTVWSLGENDRGQLGLGDQVPRAIPAQVQGLPSIVDIGCGDGFSMAQDADGVIYAWGDNASSQLGPYDAYGPMWLEPYPTKGTP
jgi:alpha-tubulin suppressor-like RCC1 family protein